MLKRKKHTIRDEDTDAETTLVSHADITEHHQACKA